MKKNEAITIAQHYVDAVRQQGIPVLEAKLFGSHVTGKSSQWSDIDVCLVSPTFTNAFESRVRLMHMKHAISEQIEPHPFTPEDMNSKWIPLASEIQKQGIALNV